MAVNVDIPELGESVTEAILVEWLKQDGDYVKIDEPVCQRAGKSRRIWNKKGLVV